LSHSVYVSGRERRLLLRLWNLHDWRWLRKGIHEIWRTFISDLSHELLIECLIIDPLIGLESGYKLSRKHAPVSDSPAPNFSLYNKVLPFLCDKRIF
jgi:hypothetical protein